MERIPGSSKQTLVATYFDICFSPFWGLLSSDCVKRVGIGFVPSVVVIENLTLCLARSEKGLWFAVVALENGVFILLCEYTLAFFAKLFLLDIFFDLAMNLPSFVFFSVSVLTGAVLFLKHCNEVFF